MGRDSLLYRVFKAKYFLRCDFLQARQSIMAGQNIVKRGMRWQVGNGQSIRIWMDKWTLNPSIYKIMSPPASLPTHLLFADDSLLFCRATIKESGKILEILNMYEEASGQKINRSKMTLFFSKCTHEKRNMR